MKDERKTQCEETVYAGSTQYDRIHGHQCKRNATTTVVAKYEGAKPKQYCAKHAEINVERYGMLVVA